MLKFLKSLKLQESGAFEVFGKAGTIGLHMVSGILVGGFIGYWLDRWLGTDPWLKIVFFIFGVGGGFYSVYLDTRLLLKEQEKKDAAKTKTPD